MWKVTSVQISNERGAVTTTQGTLSRLSEPEWTLTLEEREVVAERAEVRLRIPRELVVIEERKLEDAKPAKRSREAA